MHSSPESPPSDRVAAALFEEFVRACESGLAPDVEAWCARAGSASDELRRRIELFRTLEALGKTLKPPPVVHGAAEDERNQAAAGESDAALPPTLVAGRFESLVPIGQGGSSRVYRAYDRELKRLVALKLISPLYLVDRTEREWMLQEGRSLARLEHPNVVRVYDVGEADGFAYIAMEWLEGPTLHAVLEAMRAMTRGESESDATAAAFACARFVSTRAARTKLFLDLARAVQYCHERGVLHRDLKPGNVILQPDGTVKLIDFGLAHVASAGESATLVTERLMGTAPYIAPEQLERGSTGADPLSDQFSLSVQLYELLTLVNPFHKPTRSATCDAITRADPPHLSSFDPSIPDDLDRIARHGLERSPASRYPSVKELADDVEAWLEHRAISLAPPSPWKLVTLWARRTRKELVLVSSLVLAGSAALCMGWVYQARDARLRLTSELEEIDRDHAALTTPHAFLVAYPRCAGAEDDARDLDRGLFATISRSFVLPDAHARMEACSARLASVLAKERKHSGAKNDEQACELNLALMNEWGGVLAMDQAYCPECPLNKEDRERGLVELPIVEPDRELRLFRYGAMPMRGLCKLEPIPMETVLGPGSYRCQVLCSDGTLEIECDVRAYIEDKRRKVDWRALDNEFEEQMFSSKAVAFEVPGVGTVSAPACRMLRRPISWSDLRRVYAESAMHKLKKRFEALLGRTVDEASPAVLLVDEMREVATRVGARLPTGGELAAAQTSPEFQRARGSDQIAGEFVAGPVDGTEVSYLVYASASNPGTPQVIPNTFMERGALCERSIDGVAHYFTFRLARSDLR